MRQVLWILLGLVLVVAAGCGHSQPAFSSAGGGSVLFSAAPRVTGRPAAPACSLLVRSDVVAVAQSFMTSGTTITVADQGQAGSEQGVNSCFYVEKGYFAEPDGSQSALLSGAGASLTYVQGAADYDFSPRSGSPISGLGDGAYWDDGANRVVVRKGADVLQVSDVVPVGAASDLKVSYRKASTLLAARILGHL